MENEELMQWIDENLESAKDVLDGCFDLGMSVVPEIHRDISMFRAMKEILQKKLDNPAKLW